MSNASKEHSKNTSASAGLRKIIFFLVLAGLAWVIFGQVIPNITIPGNSPAIVQTMQVPVENQTLRRHSVHDVLDKNSKKIQALSVALTRMDERVKSLETAKKSSPDSITKNVKGSINKQEQTTLEKQLMIRQEEQKRHLKILYKKLQRLQNNPPERDPVQQERLASIEDSINYQQDVIQAIKTEIAAVQQQTAYQLSALASFIPMKEAIQRGEVFEQQLEQLLHFSHKNHTVNILANKIKPFASKGVVTFAVLKGEFDRLLLRALASDNTDNTIVSNLRSLISIRKVGEIQGTEDESIFARAEQRLTAGDLHACLAELTRLSPRSSRIMKGWTIKAQHYVNLRKILDDMQLALTQDIPSITATLPEKKAPILKTSSQETIAKEVILKNVKSKKDQIDKTIKEPAGNQ